MNFIYYEIFFDTNLMERIVSFHLCGFWLQQIPAKLFYFFLNVQYVPHYLNQTRKN